VLGPLTGDGLNQPSASERFRREGLDVPAYPDGFRADEGPRAEGFLPVGPRAAQEGRSVDEMLALIQTAGWEVRAYSGQLWYRPAIVTRMGMGR
jgi:hypothetical protein